MRLLVFIENEWFLCTFALILGLFIGAIANTYVLQWLSEEIPKEIIKDNHKGNENELIEKIKEVPPYQRKWTEYIPILSWIKRSKKDFSILSIHKQIAIEFFFSIGTLFLLFSFGLSKVWILHTFALWYFICGMICDINSRYCPSTLHQITIVGVVTAGLFVNGIYSTVLGLIFPGIVLYLFILVLEIVLKKEVMGGGDLKMIILSGGLLGSALSAYLLVAGAIIVSIIYLGEVIRYKKEGKEYPVPMMVGYGLAFILYEIFVFTPEGKIFFDLF